MSNQFRRKIGQGRRMTAAVVGQNAGIHYYKDSEMMTASPASTISSINHNLSPFHCDK